MKAMVYRDVLFAKNKWCRYATDVRFHHGNRPTGTMEEVKPFYSAKHKLYGYKCEVSVLPNGLCIRSTNHDLGGISDLTIFRKSLRYHKKLLSKCENEEEIDDDGILLDLYPDMWGVLVDKGYQGLQESIRALHPAKKPRNGRFTSLQLLQNTEISSDRVIVERFFGREVVLWAVMERKFKMSEGKYDTISQICGSLTNVHILNNPLRQSDENSYANYRDRLYEKGILQFQKRADSQQKYREKNVKKLMVDGRLLLKTLEQLSKLFIQKKFHFHLVFLS